MKKYALSGFFLIVLGIVALSYQGITYASREKVVDIGPVHITADTSKTIPLPPIVGVVALIGGIVLLIRVSMKN